MELTYIDGRCFEFKSDRLQFFIDEKEVGLIETTGQPSESGDYIYHLYVYYFDDRGAARRIKVGRIFGPEDLYKDGVIFTKFRNDCFNLLHIAEKSNNLFRQVLDIVFEVKR